MRTIAIVGAGQAGLLAAHALHQRGYDVTMFTEKTPKDFLENARPTGTACRWDMALDFERSLGLEHWEGQAPAVEGIHLTFSPGADTHNQLLTLSGRLTKPGMAVDVRLQSYTWLKEFEERGGRVVVESVTIARLDEIAAEHDLVIVAAGRGDVHRLFKRDNTRSTWEAPQRQLAMVNVTGVSMNMPYTPYITQVKFNFFPRYGEMFWVPWFSKGGQKGWSLVFEAKKDGPIDVFAGSSSADELLSRGKQLINQLSPWDAEWVRDAVPCDGNSWLVGAFTPEVREVVGILPSGRAVMALGDTAHSLDPIGGQGANNGNKMAKNLVEAIAEREDREFDQMWMRAVQNRFYARHAALDEFNNTLLRPLTKPGQRLLISQYGSTAEPNNDSPQQRLANRFCDNFNDPADLTPAFHDDAASRRVVEQYFGSSSWPNIKGRARIAKGQVRQKLGMPANHPATRITGRV